MIFKLLVLGFLFLEFLHEAWMEKQIKKIAKHYNIKLWEYKG